MSQEDQGPQEQRVEDPQQPPPPEPAPPEPEEEEEYDLSSPWNQPHSSAARRPPKEHRKLHQKAEPGQLAPKTRPQSAAVGTNRGSTKALIDKALRKLEKALGGRAAIAASLHLTEDLTAQEKKVCEAIAEPGNERKSLRRVIAEADPDITFARVLKMFAKGRNAEAFARALNHVHRGLPATTKHLMRTAVPHLVQCSKCKGRKLVAEGGEVACSECGGPGCPFCRGQGKFLAAVPCLECNATGEVVREPDTERMKLALQVGGLLGKDGVVVNNTLVQNRIEQTFVSNAQSFRSATDKLLYGTGTALPPAEAQTASEYFEQPAIEVEKVEVGGG